MDEVVLQSMFEFMVEYYHDIHLHPPHFYYWIFIKTI